MRRCGMEGESGVARCRKGDEGVDGDGADLCERSGLPATAWTSANEVGGGNRWSMLANSGADGKMVVVAAAIIGTA